MSLRRFLMTAMVGFAYATGNSSNAAPSTASRWESAAHSSPCRTRSTLSTITKSASLRSSRPAPAVSLYSLSGCVPAADQYSNRHGCSCDNWVGLLPTLVPSGPSACAYRNVNETTSLAKSTTAPAMTTTAPTYPALFSTTSTMTNDGEYEYWYSMEKDPDAGPFPTMIPKTMHTSMLYSGKSMSMVYATETSVNVGTMTGLPLYTAISNAIMSACTETPVNGPNEAVTTCGKAPKITGIVETDSHGNWDAKGTLDLTVFEVHYYSMDDLRGIASSIAAGYNASSLYGNHTWSPEQPWCHSIGDCSTNNLPGQHVHSLNAGTAPSTIANVPGWGQAFFTQDTAANHDWPMQHMTVHLDFSGTWNHESHSKFLCADGALIMDALAALALIPGLEWLAFLAVPALAVSATCDGLEHSEQ